MLGKHTLAPNEKTEIKVIYDTETLPGPFQKHVTLTTNIPGHEEIEIFMFKGVVEEAPQVYKNVDEVINVSHEVGIGQKIARMVPIGVIKG